MLQLIGDARVVIEAATQPAYVDAGATATDPEDTPEFLAPRILTLGADAVDVSRPGRFVVTYDVTDSVGYAAVQISRIVEVRLRAHAHLLVPRVRCCVRQLVLTAGVPLRRWWTEQRP